MEMLTKASIRACIKDKRARLDPEVEAQMNRSLLDQVLRHEAITGAATVYLYVDTRHEAGTCEIIQCLLARGQRVAVPRVKGKQMDFYYLGSLEDLEPGQFGIREPKLPCVLAGETSAPILVPGLAFDRKGHRLGYGGGYYDRFLKREPGHRKIGLAFSFQILEQIPCEGHDIVMEELIVARSRTDGSGIGAICAGRHVEMRFNMTLTEMGKRAKQVALQLGTMSCMQKNRALTQAAGALLEGEKEILMANQADLIAAAQKGMSQGLIDRLELTPARIKAMADGLLEIAALEDPVGEVLSMKTRPNGLLIGQKRVPIGVVGIIYEARPNVTSDAFGLCLKTGNAVLLKGGSDALESNKAIVKFLRTGLSRADIPEDALQLIESSDREVTLQFMRMKDYVDVLIPRGSAGLIRAAVENSTIPVIETGVGNCHIYVDESADFQMALDIIFNAKTQRIGVCNACESLVIHRGIIQDFLPLLKVRLDEKQVEIRSDEAGRTVVPEFKQACEEDWGREYLDYIISLKTVSSIEEAIAHINCYNTKHSEAIITSDYNNAQRFLNEIDAAAVYVNASTRFTDGFEFGFGAEIGISTQKLHARGPMGLKELTTTKYIIYGNGQVR